MSSPLKGPRGTVYGEHPHPILADDTILDIAVCLAQEGETPCKKILGIKELEPVYKTRFYSDKPHEMCIAPYFIQNHLGHIISNSDDYSRGPVDVITLPSKRLLWLSPFTWFKRRSFMLHTKDYGQETREGPVVEPYSK